MLGTVELRNTRWFAMEEHGDTPFLGGGNVAVGRGSTLFAGIDADFSEYGSVTVEDWRNAHGPALIVARIGPHHSLRVSPDGLLQVDGIMTVHHHGRRIGPLRAHQRRRCARASSAQSRRCGCTALRTNLTRDALCCLLFFFGVDLSKVSQITLQAVFAPLHPSLSQPIAGNRQRKRAPPPSSLFKSTS